VQVLKNTNLLTVQDLSLLSTFSILITSLIIGGAVSGVSFGYFKLMCRLFRKDYVSLEKKIFKNFDEIESVIGREDFVTMDYDNRLSYMMKQHIGPTQYPAANFRFLPYIRQFGGAIANQIDTYMAMHTMYRDISLGCLFLSVVSLGSFLYWRDAFAAYGTIILLSMPLSILSFLRSVTLRQWWVREGINGFYNLKISEYLSSSLRFRQDDE
jgi:hypothetical protein